MLIAEALSADGDKTSRGGVPVEKPGAGLAADQRGQRSRPDPVRGLAATVDGLTLELATTQLSPGEPGQLRFQSGGRTAVRCATSTSSTGRACI